MKKGLFDGLAYSVLCCDRHTDFAEFAQEAAEAGAKGHKHAYDLEDQDAVVLCNRELTTDEEAGLSEFVMEDY